MPIPPPTNDAYRRMRISLLCRDYAGINDAVCDLVCDAGALAQQSQGQLVWSITYPDGSTTAISLEADWAWAMPMLSGTFVDVLSRIGERVDHIKAAAPNGADRFHRVYTKAVGTQARRVKVLAAVFTVGGEWFWSIGKHGSGGPHTCARLAKVAASYHMRMRALTGVGVWL